jgi:hypothetical protein
VTVHGRFGDHSIFAVVSGRASYVDRFGRMSGESRWTYTVTLIR